MSRRWPVVAVVLAGACTTAPARNARLGPPSSGSSVAVVAKAEPSAAPAMPALAAPSCRLGGAATVDDSVRFRITDLADVAVAATHDAAIVTFALDGQYDCAVDGCYVYHELHALEVDSTGPNPRPRSLPTAATGVWRPADAAPFVLDGGLVVLTQGHAGPGGAFGAQDRADTMYIVRDGAIVQRSWKWFSGAFAARGFGATGLAVGTGKEWDRGAGPAAPYGYPPPPDVGPPSVRVFRLALDEPPHGELVVKGVIDPPSYDPMFEAYDAPAIDGSEERAAIAYRWGRRGYRDAWGSRSLFVAWVDPHTGKALAPPVQIAGGEVGAPALLIAGTTLHVVWSERGKGAPYRLRHVRWVSGESAPEPATSIPTPTETAMSPSLTRVGEHIAIAWMHSDGGRHGSIYAGFGPTVEEAAGRGERQSGEDVRNARDPKWGGGGETALLVWSEHDGPRRIRFASCGIQ